MKVTERTNRLADCDQPDSHQALWQLQLPLIRPSHSSITNQLKLANLSGLLSLLLVQLMPLVGLFELSADVRQLFLQLGHDEAFLFLEASELVLQLSNFFLKLAVFFVQLRAPANRKHHIDEMTSA